MVKVRYERGNGTNLFHILGSKLFGDSLSIEYGLGMNLWVVVHTNMFQCDEFIWFLIKLMY